MNRNDYIKFVREKIIPLIEDMRIFPVEHLRAIFLDEMLKVKEVITLNIGNEYNAGMTSDEVIEIATKNSWKNNVILVHNHPPGSMFFPSSGDIIFTKTILDGCKQKDFRLFDHVVIGRKGYISIRETLYTMWNDSVMSESIKIIDGFNLQVCNNIKELTDILNLLNDVYLFYANKELKCFKEELNKLNTLISVILLQLDKIIVKRNIL